MNHIPKWVWQITAAFVAAATALATYDGVSNQLGFWKLPKVVRVAIAFIPVWGWLIFVQTIALGALLSYVRSIAARVERIERRCEKPVAVDNLSEQAERLKTTRRSLVSDTRSYVARFTQTPRGRDFRDTFESTTIYSELRPHLSSEYRKAFNNRNLTMSSSGGPMDPFAKLLLDELDRLELEWELNQP